MHSTLVRAQNVFGFFTTVAACVAGVIAFSVLLFSQTPSASVDVRNVQVVKGRPHYFSTERKEYATIRFDLDADFSSLFNWNTKQLFVFITATYPSSSTSSSSPSAPPSQAIIWDLIIPSAVQLHPFSPLAYILSLPPFSSQSAPPKSSSKKKPTAKSPPTATATAATATATAPGIIHLKNQKQKYQITDISGKLAERDNVTLAVGWNVQPWVGALAWTMPDGTAFGRWKGVRGGRSRAFDMPALKGKKSAEQVKPVGEAGKPKAAEAEPIMR